MLNLKRKKGSRVERIKKLQQLEGRRVKKLVIRVQKKKKTSTVLNLIMSFSDGDSTDHDFLMEAFADVDTYLGGLSSSNSFSNLNNQFPQQQPALSLYASQSLQHGVDNDYMPLSMFAGVAVPFPDQNLYDLQQHKQQTGFSLETKKFNQNNVEAQKRTLNEMESKTQRPKKQKIGNQIDVDNIETRKEHVSYSKTLHAAAAKEKRRYKISLVYSS